MMQPASSFLKERRCYWTNWSCRVTLNVIIAQWLNQRERSVLSEYVRSFVGHTLHPKVEEQTIENTGNAQKAENFESRGYPLLRS